MFKKLLGFQKRHLKKILIIDAALILAATGGIVAFSQPAPVQGLKVESSTYSTASLTWNGSQNADAYRIYRSEDGKEFHYIETTIDNSYKDYNLRTGNNYYYAVASRNGFKKSEVNKRRAIKVVPALEKPKLSIDTSKGNVQLNISEVEGAIAYEIIRDGKAIAQTEEPAYVDEKAEPNKVHKYEVKAVRYIKDPVYSTASNTEEAELHQVPNFAITADESDISFSWDESEFFDSYKLYNGSELLAETTETSGTLSDYSMDKIYDIKLVGYNSEKKIQSPELIKKIKVFEEPMDNEGARRAACEWGISIAEDNSFAYGEGSRAHRCGCYFCGTNRRKKGSGYEKTYCCNPFVHACYAHGAGDPQMLRTCQKGDSVGMDSSDYTRYGNWTNIGTPDMDELEMGDVFVSEGHVMLYIGDGQIVHARNEGWGADTILVEDASGYYRGFTRFVMRYDGDGSGTMYKAREVDDNGNPIDAGPDENTEKADEENQA